MVTGTTDTQDTGKVEAETPPVPSAGLEKGGAKTEPEKTYRQSEVDALLGKAGQRVQAKLLTVTTERDTLKSQVETLTADITEAKESITSLTKDIEAMSENDPDKFALVKRRKEWETELASLKVEKAKIGESQKEVTQWKRDQLVYSVADEFVMATGEKVDFDSFKKATDKFRLNEREELEAFAETLGYKPKSEISGESLEPPTILPYSGKTDGGQENSDNLSPREKIEKGLEIARKKK